MNMETWREGLFQLCWQQHGGSGLAVTLEDALDLPTTDAPTRVEPRGLSPAAAIDGLHPVTLPPVSWSMLRLEPAAAD